MKLQRKVVLVFFGLLISVLVIISIFFSTIILTSYRDLEEQYVLKDLDQAVKKLDDEYSTLSAIVSDWAPWDDTFNFVNGNDADYVRSNLQSTGFDNLNLNLIVLTNIQGEIMFSGAYDLQNKTMVPVPDFFNRNLDPHHPLMNMSDPHHITAGIFMLPEDPMIIASQPIVHSDFSGQPQGVVIMGRYLDRVEISRLSVLTQPSLSFTRITNMTLSPTLIPYIKNYSDSKSGIIQQLDVNQIAGYALIKDIFGDDALILQIIEARDIYRQGVNTTIQVLFIIFLSCAFLGFVEVILLDRFLLKRMSSLAAQVFTIGKSGSFMHQVEIDGDDELSGLSTEINRMLNTMGKFHRELEVSVARFRELSDMLPQIIFEFDMNGYITYSNKFGLELFGISESDLAKKLHIIQFVITEDLERVKNNLHKVAMGEKSSGEIYTMIKKDNTLMRAILFSSPIIHDGILGGFRGSGIDISERLKLEEALIENEEKYRALTENTGDIIFSINMDGIFTYVSPQINKYGYLVDEVIGKSLQDIIHPEDIDKVKNDMTHDLEIGAQFHSNFRIFDKWGNVYWFDEKGTMRLDQSGKPIGIYGVLRDDSERKRAEDAIELANKKLNLMNNITRHDILNTITGLLGYVDMAKATTSPEEVVILLNDIRDLTRTIQRQIAFTKEYQEVGVHLPLWQGVNGVIDKVLLNFEKSGIHFIREIENMEIYADPLLEKVFFNLVDNALRYGEMISAIRIYTQMSGTNLLLIFEDDGVGIPADQKIRIFERGVGRNTGMGLFLTHEILAITGISIKENGIPEVGARLEIQIPWGTFRFETKSWSKD
ncbi:MAG: CHASE4 domain-containing protein [Methanobacteriota archaeon]